MNIRKSDALKGLKRDFKKLYVEFWRYKRKGKIEKYIRSHKVKCLHLGSDISLLKGWLCSDIEPKNRESIYLDATKPFPFNENTFDYIYSEHMIEHISRPDGAQMLQEAYRVLKRGGKIRIATPDLERILNLYYKGTENYGKEYIKWITDQFVRNSKGYSAIVVINTMFREWGHCFLYDQALLTTAFEEAGFSNIRRYSAGISDDELLHDIESHHLNVGNKEMVEFETLVLEASK